MLLFLLTYITLTRTWVNWESLVARTWMSQVTHRGPWSCCCWRISRTREWVEWVMSYEHECASRAEPLLLLTYITLTCTYITHTRASGGRPFIRVSCGSHVTWTWMSTVTQIRMTLSLLLMTFTTHTCVSRVGHVTHITHTWEWIQRFMSRALHTHVCVQRVTSRVSHTHEWIQWVTSHITHTLVLEWVVFRIHIHMHELCHISHTHMGGLRESCPIYHTHMRGLSASCQTHHTPTHYRFRESCHTHHTHMSKLSESNDRMSHA